MKSFDYVITDLIGIHARPAGNLVKTAQKFKCDITINKGNFSANAKGLFDVLRLNVSNGDFITVTFDGEEENNAFEEIKNLFEAKL